jgi:hypothetical protein
MLMQATSNDAIRFFPLQWVGLLSLLLGTPPVLNRVSMPVAASLTPASSKIHDMRITGRGFTNGSH